MKILRLDLLAFGPFTDQSLVFDSEQKGLAIVYGPNEAGKSSALRGLHQFLYGIPHNSSDNFLHANPNLRIGALLEKSSGEQLSCIRRKGRVNTLRGEDDQTIVEQEQLLEWLGRIDEQAFAHRFGIDYGELVRGGQAIVQGEGDLGQILFASGAGLVDLQPVQQQLATAGQALFKQRGSVQQINVAVTRLADVRKTIKAAQLPSAQWVERDQALRQAQTRNEQINQQLLERGAQRSELERIRDALPVIGRLRHTRRQFEGVASIPLLPDTFAEIRREAVTQHQIAQTVRQQASESAAALEKSIGTLEVPQQLLHHANAIGQLKEELGSYRKAAHDRPRLISQRDQIEREASTILKQLGREAAAEKNREEPLEERDDLRVSKPLRLRIQELAQDRNTLVSKHEQAKQAGKALAQEAQRTQTQLDALPSNCEPDELQRVLRLVGQQGDLERQAATLGSELQLAQEQAAVDLNKLPDWPGSLEALERLPIPVPETVSHWIDQQDTLESELASLIRREEELRLELAELDQQIEQHRLQQDVPTEEDLEHTRQDRDQGWQYVLRAWQQGLWQQGLRQRGTPTSDTQQPFIQRWNPEGDLASAYEASVAEADRVADRLRREADQVAEKTARMAQREKQANRLQRLTEQRQQVEEQQQQLQQQLQLAWQETSIRPLAPREMRDWIDRQSALIEAAESIRRQQTALAELEQRIEQLRASCHQALENRSPKDSKPTNGESLPATTALSLSELVDRCERRLLQIQSDRDQRSAIQRDLLKLVEKQDQARHSILDAQERRQDWHQQWGTAVRQLGLDQEASPTEAHSVLESIGEWNEKLAEIETLRDRIEGIDQDANRFRTAVHSVTKKVGTDLSDDLTQLDVAQAVSDLHDQLAHAQRAQSRHEELQRQLKQTQQQQLQAQAKSVELELTLEALCQEAGCQSPEQLPAIEAQSAERKRLQGELREYESRLLELAAGEELEAWIARVEKTNPDTIEPTLLQWAEEIEQLDRQRHAGSETIGSQRTELERMDGSARAAEAQEEAEQLLAQLRTDTRQYARFHLASAVLQRAIEQYRQQSQGPVLERASRLFCELTQGLFDGLRVDSNEKGDAALMGIRAGGERVVGVEGMSEGTCDQLYLALRIASLETYLAEHEPVPLIVDDILIQFDDQRATAALQILAQLSERTQVIFFTHHQHLVQLAKENLTEDTFHLHSLDSHNRLAGK
jgi:uncharacterized protein YhaN